MAGDEQRPAQDDPEGGGSADEALRHLVAGIEHFQNARFAEADAELSRATELDPENADAWAALAINRATHLPDKDAEGPARQVIRLQPDSARGSIALGLALEEQDRSGEAEGAYRRVLELEPANARAHQHLARTLRKQGKWSDAEAALREAISLDAADAAAHRGLGYLLLDLKRYDEARDCFRCAVERDDRDPLAHSGLGVALAELDHVEEAAEAFERATKLDPSDADTRHNLGLMRLRQGRLKQAEVALRHAVDARSDRGASYRLLGVALGKLDRFEEAAEAFERATKLDPGDADAHHNLGLMRLRQGRLKQAEVALQDAVDRRTNALTYLFLGAALDEQNRLEEAAKTYRRALEIDPKDGRALNNLGTVLARQERFPEAEDALRQAIKVAPDRVAPRANLGVVLAKQHRHDEARDECTRAIELDPKDPRVHLQLGTVLDAQEHYAEAKSAFQRAIALETDAPTPEPYFSLSVVQMRVEELEAAEVSARRARELGAERAASGLLAAIYIRMAERYQSDDYFEDALNETTRALSAETKEGDADAALEFRRGYALAKTGRSGKARSSFRAAHNTAAPESSIALAASRNLRRLASAQSQDIPASLKWVSLVLGVIGASVGVWLAADGQLPSSTANVLIAASFVLALLPFVLPTLTKVKVAGVELEKQAAVRVEHVELAGSETLTALSTVTAGELSQGEPVLFQREDIVPDVGYMGV